MDGKLRNKFLIQLTLKEQREDRRIRAVEIAAETGISLPAITRWLKNDVSRFEAPVVEAFCRYFDCDVGDLLYIEPEKKEG